MPATCKKGWTIVELLVCLAIIAVIAALLLPAIQYAREEARRFQCASNIRQTALGLFNYHDSHRQFPGFAEETIGDWTIECLPYIGEEVTYSSFDHASHVDAPSNIEIAKLNRPILYSCPSSVLDQSDLFGQLHPVPICHFFLNTTLMAKPIPTGAATSTFLLQESPNEQEFLSPWVLGPNFPAPFPANSGMGSHRGSRHVFYLDGHLKVTGSSRK